jgi:Mg2+-importing ATPase
MFSVAGASLFLPFLPLLPKQILLANILTDLPELAIASDRVDNKALEKPHRWNISFIRRFMLVFGAVSSVFDYLTFGLLLWVFDAGAQEFQTAWFIESVASASLIVLIIRTQGPSYKSKPGNYLLLGTVAVTLIVLYLPFSPIAHLIGFTPLPVLLMLPIGGIILLYIIATELIKKWFYRVNKI